ncbi:MAG: CoA pyrophosphatase [Syntrophobacteraceae bacterium]|nr:CoA pyrophosphatase [Syntrophobacteraceae bacterium]
MNSAAVNMELVFDTTALRSRVRDVLSKEFSHDFLFPDGDCEPGDRTSSVLLLLGEFAPRKGAVPEAGIILNKRSQQVRQPGDLCCPGGGVEKFDHFLARLLSLGGSTLSKWPCWNRLKTACPRDAAFLSLLYAAGLREGFEEMGINPFGLTFLGPLPTHCLIMYRQDIHPIVAWMSGQKRFRLSREVERIVRFPLRALLDPGNYACYRVNVPPHLQWRLKGESADFPAFVHTVDGRAELLWGATFRIVTTFLEMIFDFEVPDLGQLPLICGRLDENYINGGANDKRLRFCVPPALENSNE